MYMHAHTWVVCKKWTYDLCSNIMPYSSVVISFKGTKSFLNSSYPLNSLFFCSKDMLMVMVSTFCIMVHALTVKVTHTYTMLTWYSANMVEPENVTIQFGRQWHFTLYIFRDIEYRLYTEYGHICHMHLYLFSQLLTLHSIHGYCITRTLVDCCPKNL